ncbi:MAG: S24 family peptidase [Candidatus Solibacter sp.]
MPISTAKGSVRSIAACREGVYVLLDAVLPGRPPCPLAVLLIDSETGRPWFRMRRDFSAIAAPEEGEVLAALEDHMRACMQEIGAEEYLQSLEDSLSNILRVSPREAVAVDAFSRVLDRLFREHVEDSPVERFATHLPLISLRAAAGGLGDEMLSEVEDWVPAPEGLRLAPDLFIAHVEGRSMEPRIPDGSLNLFRLNPVGSRQGKILLVERFGVVDGSARYTVKRYTSRKVASDEGEWRHAQIRLEPLNPEFEAWDVDPEGFAVVAEWLRVIE